MKLHTASEVISLARRLETQTATLYERLARRGDGAETIRGFATENNKNIVQIERAYYGVISDALEGGFAFDLEETEYSMSLPQEPGLRDGLKAAQEIEAKIGNFYAAAAKQSQGLLADVPRVFTSIAEKKRRRVAQLSAMLDATSA